MEGTTESQLYPCRLMKDLFQKREDSTASYMARK